MLNQDKIFKSLKEELVVLKTLKSGPISDIYLCLFKEKKSIMRVDRSWTSSMKFDRQTEILLINEIIKLNLAPKILHSDTKLGLLIWRFVEGDEFFLDSINNKKNLIDKQKYF
jgi:predicted Ser/Thr protein kinase